MQVRDYMTTGAASANLRDGLRQTYERMLERKIRHLPVLDGDEKLVGIVSDRDILRPKAVDQVDASHYYALDNSMCVEEAMTKKLVSVSPDDSLEHALDLLLEGHFGALPVSEEDRNLVGIITTIDLLRAFRNTLGG